MSPLEGLLVLDLSQFLSGPSAALRLGDLGARVIKVERPSGGDICRTLYLTDTDLGGDSTLFNAINRNKESLALDLKSPDGRWSMDTAGTGVTPTPQGLRRQLLKCGRSSGVQRSACG